MPTLKNFIKTVLLKENTLDFVKPRVQNWYLSKHYPAALQEIYNTTSFLPDTAKLAERLYCIYNNVSQRRKCVCGQGYLTFDRFKNGYRSFCSPQCPENIKHVKEENKKTNLLRYGVEHNFQIQEVKDKVEETFLRKYGDRKLGKCKAVIDKRKATCVKKYGGNAPACSKEVASRVVQSHRNRSTVQKANTRDKFIQTCLDRYGVTNPSQFSETAGKISKAWKNKTKEEIVSIIQKRQEYCLGKYGVSNIMKTDYYRNKLRDIYNNKTKEQLDLERERLIETCLDRYGVPNFNQQHLNPKLIEFRKNHEKYKKWLYIMHTTLGKPLYQIAKYLGIDGAIVGADMQRFNLKVTHYYSSSVGEEEIHKYLKQLDPSLLIERNTRSVIGKELDIYLPDHKIAIEFNGLYWHSYNEMPSSSEKEKHKVKTNRCMDQGIRLFHIFENEWEDPRTNRIWKNILRQSLNKTKSVIYARNCSVERIPASAARPFYITNHLQGFCLSTEHYGLVYKDELVAVMSFLKKDRTTYDLSRFCSKLNFRITGGASKLLAYFEKQHPEVEQIITFADLRYSYGDLYYALGFIKDKILPIKHYYTDRKEVLHARRFQKQYLTKLIGTDYDPNKTEIENVINNTAFRVLWDAGKIRFVKNVRR